MVRIHTTCTIFNIGKLGFRMNLSEVVLGMQIFDCCTLSDDKSTITKYSDHYLFESLDENQKYFSIRFKDVEEALSYLTNKHFTVYLEPDDV